MLQLNELKKIENLIENKIQKFNTPLIVNFFGGPCVGKTTLAAGLFYELKRNEIEVEFAMEECKKFVWEKNWSIFENQLYIFGLEHQKLFRLCQNEIDVVITDSPILLSLVYDIQTNPNIPDRHVTYDEFRRDFYINEFQKFKNLNFLIKRTETNFSKIGRRIDHDTLAINKQFDLRIERILEMVDPNYHSVDINSLPFIVREVLGKIEEIRIKNLPKEK